MTFFWNGNRSGYFDSSLETYVEVPSDNVPFNEKPDMKAREIAAAAGEALRSGKFDQVRVWAWGWGWLGCGGLECGSVCVCVCVCVGLEQKARATRARARRVCVVFARRFAVLCLFEAPPKIRPLQPLVLNPKFAPYTPSF